MSFLENNFSVFSILDSYKLNEQITMTIIPITQIYYSEESGFGVYYVEDDIGNTFSIKGVFISELIIGQTYSAEGKVIIYKGEKQLSIVNIKNVQPVNRKGIISYLQTLKGLKSKAELIYDKFGDKSIQILMSNPMAIADSIFGIGEKSVLCWKEQLDKLKESQYAITRLLSFGLTNKQSKLLYDRYKDSIIDKIEMNPYFLSKEVKGYGFLKCDKIARNIGYNPLSTFRIQEGIIHVLENASNAGHCFLLEDTLINNSISLLTIKLSIQEMTQFSNEMAGKETFEYYIGQSKYIINYHEMRKCLNYYQHAKSKEDKENNRYVVVSIDKEAIINNLKILELQERIVIEKKSIYLKELYLDEEIVATRVCFLLKESPFQNGFNLEDEFESYLFQNNIELEEMQKKAVLEIAKYKGGFYIINGFAGTGKTFVLKIILTILEKQYDFENMPFTVKIMAPTGKASKVASKSTKLPCTTIHRGLSYNSENGFLYDSFNPIDADCIVIDETSMLDISLAKRLLLAISNGTKVIFMGDTHQLPSIGPGNILKDLIESNILKVITLNVVKRQDKLSGIIRNATRIINSEIIENCVDTEDAYLIYRNTPDGVNRAIIESINRILNIGKFSFDDIQILCPQKNGSIGTYYMNYLIQQNFNKCDSEYTILNKKFEVTLGYNKYPEIINLSFKKGDKVIHIKNNYDMLWYKKLYNGVFVDNRDILGITNGECGVIEDIIKFRENNELKTRVIVKYDDGYVYYDEGLEELDHAYALTIHKSQGSQWPAVIIPLMMCHYKMLDNNLFYTGYTRAESFSVIIAQMEALEKAITTHNNRERNTGLKEKLNNLYTIIYSNQENIAI